MKIPIQNKIAELESRIVALENNSAGGRVTCVEYSSVKHRAGESVTTKGVIDSQEWRDLWDSFSRLMSKTFGRNT